VTQCRSLTRHLRRVAERRLLHGAGRRRLSPRLAPPLSADTYAVGVVPHRPAPSNESRGGSGLRAASGLGTGSRREGPIACSGHNRRTTHQGTPEMRRVPSRFVWKDVYPAYLNSTYIEFEVKPSKDCRPRLTNDVCPTQDAPRQASVDGAGGQHTGWCLTRPTRPVRRFVAPTGAQPCRQPGPWAWPASTTKRVPTSVRLAWTLRSAAQRSRLRGTRNSISSRRTRLYGSRFLPRVLVSTDTSAGFPQPTGVMKSRAMRPPFLRAKSIASSLMCICIDTTIERCTVSPDGVDATADGPDCV